MSKATPISRGQKPVPKDDEPPLTDWHEKATTCRLLGISEKTLERWVHDGKLEQRTRPRRGKRPAAVYHPGDVIKLREQATPPAFVMTTPVPVPAATVATVPDGPLMTMFESMLTRVLDRERKLLPPPPAPEPFLRLRQVTEEWPLLTRGVLLKLINTGVLPVVGRRPIVIARSAVLGLTGS